MNKILNDYCRGAEHQARQQPVKNPMLEKLRSEISASDKQEIDKYIKAVDREQPVRKTLDEVKDEVAKLYGRLSWDDMKSFLPKTEKRWVIMSERLEIAYNIFASQTKAVEPQEGWVDVKTRLPEERGDFLVYNNVLDKVYQEYYNCGENSAYEGWKHTNDKDITHWMNLPPKPTT